MPSDTAQPKPPARLDASTELAAHRTGMSLHRTRMSADRTLMSVMRTALSLIGFGFTIFQFFLRLRSSNVLASASQAPRRFGLALVFLGVGMLVLGLAYHFQFMYGLRAERRLLVDRGLVPATTRRRQHGPEGGPVRLMSDRREGGLSCREGAASSGGRCGCGRFGRGRSRPGRGMQP
jgi:putative membrane protein